MNSTLQDLFTYKNIIKQNTREEYFDMQTVVKAVMAGLNWQLMRHNVQIRTTSFPSVYANPFQILQLLQYLIGNIIKAIPEDQKAEILIQYEPTEGNCGFKISCTPCLINVSHANQAFRQLGSSSHTLNLCDIELALCGKIVRRYGGTINISAPTPYKRQVDLCLPIIQEKQLAS